MNEPNFREEFSEAIQSVRRVAPQMRLGQIVAAAGELCADLHGRGLWDAEDAELLEALWKLNRDLEQHSPAGVRESA